MKKIAALTPEQIAKFPEYVKRWTSIGLSTLPADRPTAEAAINAAYVAAGLKPPQKIVWCESPFSQGLTRAIILDKKMFKEVGASVGASVGDSVRGGVWASVWDSVRDSVLDSVRASVRASVWASVWDSVRDSVGESVWASVGASVRDSVWASVRDSVGESVGASVRASVWASVWDSVGASVRASVRGGVRDSVRDSVLDSGYGQHDANWLAFYEFFREEVKLNKQTDKLIPLTDLAKSAGWFLPHANICWVSERHNILNRDNRGRLHSMTGPAVAYPDGWAIYAVHGVRVPADIIENPASVTADRVRNEKNAEVRRVMMQILGFERYISEIGADKIHTDQFGTLYRVNDESPFHIAHVINSSKEPDGTYKPYYLPCPDVSELTGKRIKTAHEAVAWTFGLHASEYKPSVQT